MFLENDSFILKDRQCRIFVLALVLSLFRAKIVHKDKISFQLQWFQMVVEYLKEELENIVKNIS